jgi:hypothetical protein
VVDEHNARRSENHQFRLGLLPEPFMGSTRAAVVLLNLNPGFAETDRDANAPPDRHEMMRQSLTHELPDDEAFYFLTDQFERTRGGRWWRKKLAPLIREVGLEALRRNTQAIEHVPYKSRRSMTYPRPYRRRTTPSLWWRTPYQGSHHRGDAQLQEVVQGHP